MSTSVKIKTDSQNKLLNSTKRNIVLSIIHNRDKFQIAISVPPVEAEHLILLNDGYAEISTKEKAYPNRAWTNKFIASEKERVESILLELQETGRLQDISTKELKVYIRNYKSKENISYSFFEFADKLFDEKVSIGRHNTARSMKAGISSFRNFNYDVTFQEITYTYLKSFETWYLKKGNSLNGLAGVMRYVRTVFNRAIKEDMISESNYPFKKYSIKTTKTRKRAITREELKMVFDYVPTCKSEQLSKDVFLFSFYNAGINFKDIAFLTNKNIKENRLIYSRGKTGAHFSLTLNKESLKILKRYKNDGKYLFPLILQTELTGFDMIKHINNRNHRVNEYMRNIGEKLEFEFPLTSYVARHSFATIAKKNNVPIAAISELLGHEDIKTTQIYLGSLDSNVLDEYQNQITEL